MNILAHLAAMVAVGWLIQFLFVTLSEPILGVAAVIIFALLLPMAWIALKEDQEILK